MAKNMLDGAQVIVDYLIREKVPYAFGLCGHGNIVDEWNLDDLARSPHIADSRPIGLLSSAFMKRVCAAAADRIRARRYRSVPRR
jgi:hypothetical protein